MPSAGNYPDDEAFAMLILGSCWVRYLLRRDFIAVLGSAAASIRAGLFRCLLAVGRRDAGAGTGGKLMKRSVAEKGAHIGHE
jgi:hypothetical protein